MPTTENQASEVLRLLADADKDNLALDTERQRVNSLISTTVRQTEAMPRPLTAKQSLDLQQAGVQAQAAHDARFQQASRIIRQTADKYELGGDQEYQSRKSGELGAVLNADLEDQVSKAYNRALKAGEDIATNEQYLLAVEAQKQFQENEQVFHMQANGIEPGQPLPWQDSERFGAKQVKELRTNKGLLGSARNVVGGAIGGLVGLGGIAASALGAEELGQTLAGAGQGIQDTIGTQDLAGRAAELEFGDIVSKAQSGDLPLTEAMLAAGKLAATDIDAFTNLAETIGSAGLGGGGLGVAGRVAGRVAGAGATAQTAARVGAQVAPRGTGASFVGLGQGVDENLTSDQARILAGTGIVAGQLARFGSAENVLGNVARRVTPGLSPTTTAGTAGVTRSALGGAVGTATAEAAQEFVEGTGEGIGQAAQQGGSFAAGFTPEALTTAARGGAVAAPLGAIAGGAIGAGGGALQGRANNAAAAQEVRDQNALVAQQEAAQAEQDAAAIAQANERAAQVQQGQEETDALRAGRDQRLGAARDRGLRNADFAEADLQNRFRDFSREVGGVNEAIGAESAALDQSLTTRRGQVQEFGLDTPLDQVGQLIPQRADLGSIFPALGDQTGLSLDEQIANTDDTVAQIQEYKALDPEAQEIRMRALFRNSFGEQLAAENAFVDSFTSADTSTARNFVAALESSAAAAFETNVEPSGGLDAGASARAQADIDAQQTVQPASTEVEQPGVAEAEARTQRRAATQTDFDKIVQSTPKAAQVSDPTVFKAEDIGSDGRLRAPVDLNVDPADIANQVAPTATVENTILADGQTLTAVSKGKNEVTPVLIYRKLAAQTPEQRQDSLEALAISSGLTPEQASDFALEVGAPSGTVGAFQQRVGAALSRYKTLARPAPAAVEATADTAVETALPGATENVGTEVQPDELFESAEDGEIFLLPEVTEGPNAQITRLLNDESSDGLSNVQAAKQTVRRILQEQVDSGSEALTQQQANQLLEAVRAYERATGKKL